MGPITPVGTLAEISHPPDLLVVMPGANAVRLVGAAKGSAVGPDVPILAVAPASASDSSAAALIAAGADEVVLASAPPAIFAAQVRGLLRRRAAEKQSRELAAVHDAMGRVQSIIAEGGDAPESLREVMLVAVSVLGVDRAALVAHVKSSEQAYVIAATDDPSLSQFILSLQKYPELRAASESGEPVLIADTREHPITAEVADLLEDRGIRALAVFPCFWRGRALGGLLFRKSQPGLGQLTQPRIDFANGLASQIAAQLRDSHVVERLTEGTRRISRASYEAERRLRTIESLKEHFEASADGVVVLDEAGYILFLNGAAESITGFARDGLVGVPLVDLVPEEQRAALEEVIKSVLGGTNLEAFDLDVHTTSGEPICVSVTTSTVLAKSSAVILSFRDVTAERALEAELSQTKDFLERLIDSAVDAIVAADMHGRIILFNPGAERVFGHRAEKVIGRLPVWRLYPPGLARHLIQMLRSPTHGGVGRLEETRLEVVTSDGELVPVNMTASILYENGREVATVGILSDLRERLRMEERLLDVQEQLEAQERQAMVAQLAGAAAHELNQPLTSILGYAQLMERQSEPDAPHARALQIILREVQRMADIVRKIGRITRYEVKEYVGSASIMDLDRSAAANPELRIPDDESGEPTAVSRDPTLAVADLEAAVEAALDGAEEEITSQHLILARSGAEADAGDIGELPPLPGQDGEQAEDTRPGTLQGRETGEPATDRISARDAPAPKRSSKR
jgi:PAS domain S-box-containing protein